PLVLPPDRLVERERLVSTLYLVPVVRERPVHGVAKDHDELHIWDQTLDAARDVRVEHVIGRGLPDDQVHARPASRPGPRSGGREPGAIPPFAPLVVEIEVPELLGDGAGDGRMPDQIAVERRGAGALG